MRRKNRDFGRLRLLALFLFVSVFLSNVINALNSSATGTLGSFETGETGIKLCAQIDAGPEDSLRFLVTNDQGFSSDVIVDNDTCKNIKTEAATYTIRHYLPQEYAIDEVSGGTVSADNTPFVATASGQYAVIYSDTYSAKGYLHSFGWTLSNQVASAVDVYFDANGGTGTMNTQRFGLNSQQALTQNAFTRTDYNFTGWNTKADGSGQSYTDEQSISFATGGEITLYAQWTLKNYLYNEITSRQNNGVDTNVDFTANATVADGNGNGLNIRSGTENDDYPIYYFRGEVSDNNVVWANKCWKIVRTTDTGGTKMIYNGEASDVDVNGETVKQCLATGANYDNTISVDMDGTNQTTFAFNSGSSSPADAGYMYGDRLIYQQFYFGSTVYTFSNDVSRNGDTYTLDTASNQSVTGTWADERINAATRYHYFCTDGATVCDKTKIGYIFFYADTSYAYYLKIGGYDDIGDAKAGMFANTNDSTIKIAVDTWFEQENLDGHEAGTRNYEDDLEDTIYCNNRTFTEGPLVGKDSDGTPVIRGYYRGEPIYFTFNNNRLDKANPSLSCNNKNDSFTKTDSVRGNASLRYKVGLLSEGEKQLVDGMISTAMTIPTLLEFNPIWGMSGVYTILASSGSDALPANANYYPVRPMVSLRNDIGYMGGTGTTTDPYIVE